MFLFTVYLDRKCVWNYCVLDAFDPLPGHRRETLSCVSMCRMILGQMSIHSISCSWNQAHVQDFRIISGWWIRFQWLLRCRMPKHWRDLMTPQHPRITLAFCVHCFTQFTYDRNYPRTSLRRFWCHVICWFFLVPRERSGAWALGSRSARNLDGQEHKLHRLHGLRRLLVVQLCSILKLCLAALFGYLWRCSWFFAETQSIWAWWAESSSFSIRRSFEGATSDTLTLWNTYFLRK